MKLVTRELTAALWPKLEELFGTNGACGGCWCMAWRLQKGEKWAELKGDTNRKRLRVLVRSGRVHGILAFDGPNPVGWCNFGPRIDFAKLDRAPSLKCDDADRVWSLPCFFVQKDWRNRGVGSALLQAALKVLKRRGVKTAEAYPVRLTRAGQKLPGPFIWTGTTPMFLRAGFRIVGNKGGGKERVRKDLVTALSE